MYNFILDKETGELISRAAFSKRFKVTDDEKKKAPSIGVCKLFSQDKGFCFFDSTNLLKLCKGSYTLLLQALYLASYLDYDNQLVFNHKELTPADLRGQKNVWKVHRTNAVKTYHELCACDIIEVNGGLVRLTEKAVKCIFRGEVGVIKSRLCRSFFVGIRELYEKSSKDQKKSVGHIVNLLPYVDPDSNLVLNKNHDPATTSEVAKILGYAKRGSYLGCLMDIKVNDVYLLIREVTVVQMGEMVASDAESVRYYINPYVFWGGQGGFESARVNQLIEIIHKAKTKKK